MTNQEQAFVEGFVKRADERGVSYNEAISLLKEAVMTRAPFPMAPQQHTAPNVGLGNTNQGNLVTPQADHTPAAPQAPEIPQSTYQHNPIASPAPEVPAASQPEYQPQPLPSAMTPPGTQFQYETPNAESIAARQRSADQYPSIVEPENSDTSFLNNPAAAGNLQFEQVDRPPTRQMARPAAIRPNPVPAALPARGVSNAPAAGVDVNTLKRLMGSYDPKSRLDRSKADAIRQIYSPGMRAQSIYDHPAYRAASMRRR
jgi:hypothetical protein